MKWPKLHELALDNNPISEAAKVKVRESLFQNQCKISF